MYEKKSKMCLKNKSKKTQTSKIKVPWNKASYLIKLKLVLIEILKQKIKH